MDTFSIKVRTAAAAFLTIDLILCYFDNTYVNTQTFWTVWFITTPLFFYVCTYTEHYCDSFGYIFEFLLFTCIPGILAKAR